MFKPTKIIFEFMEERKKRVVKIFLPNDFLRNISTQQYKTMLLGNLSRYCCIFKINEINFYEIPDHWKQEGYERELIQDVLNYLITPQYIRKYLFQRKKTLSDVGILHPLNTPNHPVEKENLEVQVSEGETMYREGVVIKIEGNDVFVDIGLNDPVKIQRRGDLKLYQVINLKIVRKNQDFIVTPVDEGEIPYYWGYKVKFFDEPFKDILKMLKPADILVATSKRGVNYKHYLREPSKFAFRDKKTISVFFGSRTTGLSEFFNSWDELEGAFDFIINCFDAPGTKSVRLEEAIPIALSILDTLSNFD